MVSRCFPRFLFSPRDVDAVRTSCSDSRQRFGKPNQTRLEFFG